MYSRNRENGLLVLRGRGTELSAPFEFTGLLLSLLMILGLWGIRAIIMSGDDPLRQAPSQ
ncbi:MAG: hypothetical protein EA427_03670 [Spirochaetaceae bacterium]|nr:MAG: hypothetical protein EA427_03670 [Spirochaetaceae bacterium]